jgi:DNA-binding response OmpR family regulator
MPGGARVVLLSDDDDLARPLVDVLRRAGHRAETAGGRDAAAALAAGDPDLLVLDRDLHAAEQQSIHALLEGRGARESFPLLVLGSKGTPDWPPSGWHEDACLVLPRPPVPAAFEAAAASLLRLAFYRPYRDLVHDLAQPVTAIHALGRSAAKIPLADDASRQTMERLMKEAERLMTLLSDFQRRRAPSRR